MPKLFEPLTIRSLTLKNRLAVSPMCQYSSRDGFATDWHLVHLGSRAVGGAGLVIAEATAVSPEGRISPGDLGIWKDEHLPALKRIADFLHTQGAAAGIQLAHAGRKASTAEPWNGGAFVTPEKGGWIPLAPSAVPFQPQDPAPREMTLEDIRKVVRDFAEAAKRADRAGFDVVELHAAHGYLIHEFLSPLANRRTDAYGGSFANRARLAREVVAAVREHWPEGKPLFVRVSATDWKEPEGWTPEETVILAMELKTMGADLVDCSSGAMVPDAKIPAGPGFQVPFAERVRREAGIATAAVGFLTTAVQAEEIIAMGKADLVLMAREFLRNPYAAQNFAGELGADLSWPKQYGRAKPAPKA